MYISVYTIAKNEEKVVERWFNCFSEADEVCVLVNNSTDKTAEILDEFSARPPQAGEPSNVGNTRHNREEHYRDCAHLESVQENCADRNQNIIVDGHVRALRSKRLQRERRHKREEQ